MAVSSHFRLISELMALNVLAVCDVFAVAIKETVGFQQLQKCGGAKYHKGRKPDWYFAEPEPPTGRRSAYRPVETVEKL